MTPIQRVAIPESLSWQYSYQRYADYRNHWRKRWINDAPCYSGTQMPKRDPELNRIIGF